MQGGSGLDLGVREGDVIAGKYRVYRILGTGGMGVVVAAHHLRLDELVAIKLLLPEALAEEEAVRRFEREARAAVKIRSEHVARIIDVGTLDNGAPFIVMEYLHGEDLAARIDRDGPLPIEETIELVLQACEAIAEAHALGIVHRDLKPANLFCTEEADGRSIVKVLDFGISKISHDGPSFGMTRTSILMGSPVYMSPEQMQSPRSVDARTDIWSLGVVLYELLTGDIPFNGETLPQVCVNVATSPAPALRRLRADAPAGLEALVFRCLEKDPYKRYPNIAAFAIALGRFGTRRAQASVERIVITARGAGLKINDASAQRQGRTNDRRTTGPIPSWGGTANRPDGRIRMSVIGMAAIGAFVGVAAALVWTRPEAAPSSPAARAVLVTPPSPVARARASVEPRSAPLAAPTPTAPAPNPISAFATVRATAATIPPPVPVAPPPVKNTEPPLSAAVRAAASTPAASTGSSEAAIPPDTCFLNLNSIPASAVVLDGKPIGFTPKMAVGTGAGKHTISFHEPGGKRRLVSASCIAGETKTIGVRLREPTVPEELPTENPYR